MLPKAHLTSHTRMTGSMWVITPLWLSGSLRPFLYSSVYPCHLFLIFYASVRSLPFLSFIMPIFAWNVSLVSLIYLTRSLVFLILFSSVQFSSVAQSCLTLCDPMDCSTPGLQVHHQLLELTQTHVHWVSDAVQSCQSLSSPSPPTFNLSQCQGLFKWVSSSHQVGKILEFQL